MAIDVWMAWRGAGTLTERWDEATKEDGVALGKNGILRERYVGPHATHVLLPELFLQHHPSPFPWATVPAVSLRGRLPLSILAAVVSSKEAQAGIALAGLGIDPSWARVRLQWGIHDDGMDFVGWADEVPRAALLKRGYRFDLEAMQEVPECLKDPAVHERLAKTFLMVRWLVDFVSLAEEREAESGEPVECWADG